MPDPNRLSQALASARAQLLAQRAPSGHWEGWLSSSALSTATAVTALAIVEREGELVLHPARALIEQGIDWLACHANPDGGWGDTTRSISNISTTTLCWAAFGAVRGAEEQYRPVVRRAEAWLAERAGGLEPDQLAQAIIARYGKDRTFSVPILTMCALAGRLGNGPEAWRRVLPLPFELAAFPPQLFAALRLPVVSYALPALIAIGQAHHHHAPSRNPFARAARSLTRERTLRVLEKIQPASGGFLEATPLTSFVVMSLAGSGQVNHPVTQKGVEFLLASVREDGSWPIDTNLATWVTTLSVNALGPNALSALGADATRVRDWLLGQQYRERHPYTNAAPGGWAWTDLPGGVPDADDTAGALIALRHLAGHTGWASPHSTVEAARAGVRWLLDLQNGDGGIPTFCRGWTNLPFDRSSPDLTAHAIRAWLAWFPELDARLQQRTAAALARALDYLARSQRPEGAWIPLWFGNQHARDDENPLYGTARVLPALVEAAGAVFKDGASPLLRALKLNPVMQLKATEWLLSAQRSDGGWSGSPDAPASVEETALAVEALAALLSPDAPMLGDVGAIESAIERGTAWLVERVESGVWTTPAPIGFYFARLWYYERLYPVIFTVGALEMATRRPAFTRPAPSNPSAR